MSPRLIITFVEAVLTESHSIIERTITIGIIHDLCAVITSYECKSTMYFQRTGGIDSLYVSEFSALIVQGRKVVWSFCLAIDMMLR